MSKSESVVAKVDAQGRLTIVAGKPFQFGAPTPGPATQSKLMTPVSVAADTQGNAYIADSDANKVVKVRAAGELSVLAGNGTAPGYNVGVAPGPALSTALRPRHVATGPNGAVYVATTNQVLKIAGGQVTVIAGTGRSGLPTVGAAARSSKLGWITGIAVDSAGHVYIADAESNCVVRIDPATETLAAVAGICGTPGTTVPGPARAARFAGNSEYGLGEIAVDRYGDLYMADIVAGKIFKITAPTSSAATLSVLAGTGSFGNAPGGPIAPSAATFGSLTSVSVAGPLDVYIADKYWNRVAEIAGVPSVPDAPLSLEIIPSEQAVTLAFDTPADDGGSAITGYEYSIDGGVTWNAQSVTGEPRHTATVSDLTSGTSYTFLVRAVNAIGAGPTTSATPVSTTIKPSPPVSTDPATITAIDPTGHGQEPGAHVDTVGHTLQCTRGDWADSPTAYHYQWSRDGIAITGATDPAFTVQASDEGHDVSCIVTASDAVGTAQSTSTQVAIALPAGAACPVPAGTLAGAELGPVALGDTQEAVRGRLPRFDLYSYHTDNFCLKGGPGIRVGYASTRLLSEAHMRSALNGKIVLALTANPHYTLDGVRPGTPVASVAHRLTLGTPFHRGRNTWYLSPGRGSAGVLKVRHGIILEVGIANRQLTDHRAAEHQLLRSF